jgi:hypothetical protein
VVADKDENGKAVRDIGLIFAVREDTSHECLGRVANCVVSNSDFNQIPNKRRSFIRRRLRSEHRQRKRSSTMINQGLRKGPTSAVSCEGKYLPSRYRNMSASNVSKFSKWLRVVPLINPTETATYTILEPIAAREIAM